MQVPVFVLVLVLAVPALALPTFPNVRTVFSLVPQFR